MQLFFYLTSFRILKQNMGAIPIVVFMQKLWLIYKGRILYLGQSKPRFTRVYSLYTP